VLRAGVVADVRGRALVLSGAPGIGTTTLCVNVWGLVGHAMSHGVVDVVSAARGGALGFT
jgi:predicted ATP-dependent serine protease